MTTQPPIDLIEKVAKAIHDAGADSYPHTWPNACFKEYAKAAIEAMCDAFTGNDEVHKATASVRTSSPVIGSEIRDNKPFYQVAFDKASSRGDASCLIIKHGNTISVSLYGKQAEIVHDIITGIARGVYVE